jgi:hypothetical protein
MDDRKITLLVLLVLLATTKNVLICLYYKGGYNSLDIRILLASDNVLDAAPETGIRNGTILIPVAVICFYL